MNSESSNPSNNIQFHYISPDEDDDVFGGYRVERPYSPRLYPNLDVKHEDLDFEYCSPYRMEQAHSPSGENILSKFSNFHLQSLPNYSNCSQSELMEEYSSACMVETYLRGDMTE